MNNQGRRQCGGLALLHPAFDSLGSVTAGNASINDAAAVMMMSEAKARALGLPVLAWRIRAFASVGVDPANGIAPVYATRRCSERAGWQLTEVTLSKPTKRLPPVRVGRKMLEWDERR